MVVWAVHCRRCHFYTETDTVTELPEEVVAFVMGCPTCVGRAVGKRKAAA